MFVVVEGLDGVGKTTVADLIADRLGGVNVGRAISARVADCRKVVDGAESSEARFHFWWAMNCLASEACDEIVSSGRCAVLDSYVFRTIVVHRAAGSVGATRPIWDGLRAPDVAVLLLLEESERRSRVLRRDGSLVRHKWDAVVLEQREWLVSAYLSLGLRGLETTSRSPDEVAMAVLDVPPYDGFPDPSPDDAL